MIIRHFLKWVGNARAAERAAAAAALARAFLDHELPFEDRCEAEAALTLLLDDPCATVRAAMAEALATSHRAPPQIIAALASDQPAVAAVVIVRSPLLTDLDLIDRAAASDGKVQALIASRPRISMALAAAIAEVGEAESIETLLRNDGAEIASLSFRRIAERFGHEPKIRELLVAHPRLPADCRHTLLIKLGEALSKSLLVQAMMGEARARRVALDACARASLTLIDTIRPTEHAALVEHLRMRGDLTAAFLVRAIIHGKVDFLGAVLTSLSGLGQDRVRSILSSGRDVAITSLLGTSGLASPLHQVFLVAIKLWREVALGQRTAGAQEVAWQVLKEMHAGPGQAGPSEQNREVAGLVKSIHLEALRFNAREHALAIAAA